MAEKKVKLKSSSHLPVIRAAVRRGSGAAIDLAEFIAQAAEPPMEEFRSADALEQFLRRGGLRVTRPWKSVPTAFLATAGRGRPRVAILAEYDALPDCGPRSGQWGHGCGHNLLGAGSALAGLAAAEALARRGLGGQVLVIGTPAEEALSGKVILAHLGAFDRLDAILVWHPAGACSANVGGGLAMDSISFLFRGRTAHAAAGPHQGRSALDGAILTDVAANYLREHVEDNARIHSVIPSGGTAPNVVPDRAAIWYYLRGRDRKQVDDLRRRVTLCARGAALATETRCRVVLQDCVAERIPNLTMGRMLDALLRRCGPPAFSAADARAAAAILPGKKYAATVDPIATKTGKGSSDEDNASWFAPLGKITVTCTPKGAVAHNRQMAQLSRLSGAHRGMLKAAEVLAAAAVELIVNRPLLEAARAEFKATMRGKRYNLPVPVAAGMYARRRRTAFPGCR